MRTLRILLALGGLVALAAGAACTTDAYCYTCGAAGSGGAGGSSGPGPLGDCASDAECPEGASCCGGACIETDADPKNCGACANECAVLLNAHGSPACAGGVCTVECDAGYGDCDLLFHTGCESKLDSDQHCGTCNAACELESATSACAERADAPGEFSCAIIECFPGFADCNGEPEDGCETDLSNDPENCGACGMLCEGDPELHLKGVCEEAACASSTTCADGYGDCNGDLSDGCETELLENDEHCGLCGRVCGAVPHGDTSCQAGSCVVTACDPGYGHCDNGVKNGCETDLAVTTAHCGACDAPCMALPHATPKCTGSTCVIGACDPGFADCDGEVANGCEVDLKNDEQNCGICGNSCPAPKNAEPACANFACAIGACHEGFGDCFGGITDGCETNLEEDVNHCGSCVTVCPAVAQGTRACSGGKCGIQDCTGSYRDCNGKVADGCEVNTSNDEAHCGACGSPCPDFPHATEVCDAGSCRVGSCDLGYSDCDKNKANGCEFDTLNDPKNCGGCGIVCGSGQCASAKCACNAKVLVIGDDSETGTNALALALGNAGFSVTKSTKPVYAYDGESPAPTGFGAVVVLGGVTSQENIAKDMPATGQDALVSYVNTQGNGVVMTEWAAYHASSGRWQKLNDAGLILMSRSVAFSGQLTYSVDIGFKAHPVWEGLPVSFTFAGTSNVGTVKILPDVTRVASSPQAIDAVAIRDAAVGRVVHIAHAGNYLSSHGWDDPNLRQLVANSVRWASRCK